MSRIPTVRVVRPGSKDDYIIINESDFYSETMELWTEKPPEPERNKGPEDPEVRLAAIVEAIGALDATDESLWTKGGQPTVEALEAVLTWDITAAERGEAWTRHQNA